MTHCCGPPVLCRVWRMRVRMSNVICFWHRLAARIACTVLFCVPSYPTPPLRHFPARGLALCRNRCPGGVAPPNPSSWLCCCRTVDTRRRTRLRFARRRVEDRKPEVESASGGWWEALVCAPGFGAPGWRVGVWCCAPAIEPSGHPRRRAVWTGLPGGTRTGALSRGPGRI